MRPCESIVRNTGDCGTQYEKVAPSVALTSQPPDGQDSSACAPSATNRAIRAGPRGRRTKQQDVPGASENWSRMSAARPESAPHDHLKDFGTLMSVVASLATTVYLVSHSK